MDVRMPPVQPLVIGVTSHRNLVPRESGEIRRGVREFLERLHGEFPQLPLTVVSALAAGGDQLVAEEALALGARLIAPLPLPRAVYVRDFADPRDRERFETLCRDAVVLEPASVDDDVLDGAANDVRTRDWHYAQTGVYIASHCHLLLALWDGKASSLPGGTAQVVGYYLSGRPPALVERRRAMCRQDQLDDNNERLAYHIVCSRDEAGGTPEPPLAPLQTLWRIGEERSDGTQPMPAEGRAMFRRIEGFDLDCAKYATRIEAAAPDVSRGPADTANETRRSPIERSFAAADWLALHYQLRVQFAMRAMYTLAALMGIAFVFYDELSQAYMIFVFLFLFVLGFSLDQVAARRDWHRKYLDYRALAEGLRVQAYWRRAGLSMTGDAEFAHDNFLQKQDVDLGWIRNVMRSAGLGAAASKAAQRVELAGVIAEWVGESAKAGQLYYYERRLAERTRHHSLTRRIGALSLYTSIGISVFLALFVFDLDHDVRNVLVSIMAALSIIAAVREAYAYRKADKELIKQYRFMRRIFANARAALDRTHDAAAQREI
ncbi:MAG: hypothetical protein ACHP7D_11210, partial [Lysobacterales bacterium]